MTFGRYCRDALSHAFDCFWAFIFCQCNQISKSYSKISSFIRYIRFVGNVADLKYVFVLLMVLFDIFGVVSAGYSQTDGIPSYDVSSKNTTLGPFSVYLIRDKTKKLTIDDVASGKIAGKVASSRLHTDSKYVNTWICFVLTNKSNERITRVIHLDEPYYSEAVLYYRSGTVWHKESCGLDVPLKSRLIYNRNPVFMMKLDPGESTTVYVKLEQDYGQLMVGCFVDTPLVFFKQDKLIAAGYFLYFGFVLALILYNSFLFISLKEKVYAYYVLHGIFFAIFVLVHTGFDLYAGISVAWHYKLTAAISLVLVFISLFSRELLQTKKHFPKIDAALLVLASVGLVLGILGAIDISYYKLLTIIAAPAYLFFVFVGVYACIKRIDLSVYYISSMSLYFVGIILLDLVFMEVIPYNIIVRNAYLIGSMAELTIFSLALAYRVKLLQKQNTAYQLKVLQTERAAKERLEHEVAERTAELTRINNKLERLATHDGLTGLANRRLLDDRLLHEWHSLKREEKPLSVIMCDIDYFKSFNDYYGHQKGDTCLIEVAKAIRTCLHQPDDVAGRYGGEEFLIILPNTDIQGSMSVAAKIKETLADMALAHAKSNVAEHVTLSFGVASVVPKEGIDPERIVSFSDEALYQAKRHGRNRICTPDRTM